VSTRVPSTSNSTAFTLSPMISCSPPGRRPGDRL
jgi:hypothetical protein